MGLFDNIKIDLGNCNSTVNSVNYTVTGNVKPKTFDFNFENLPVAEE